MLEKRKELRRVEFTFTDDQVHPECHCHYEICVYEDGKLLNKSNHREVHPCDDMKTMLSNVELYAHPEPKI